MRIRTPRIAAVLVAACGISLLHYLTPNTIPLLHVIYQRSYYLPILMAAVWFGRRGGLLTAAFVAVLYLPHVFLDWQHHTTYQMVQLTEILMFFAIGAVAGSLSSRELRQKRRYMEAKEELETAYRDLRASFERLRLADRLASLGTLAAGMAHEIKNPLASISGSLEILERELGDRGRDHEFFGILRKEIGRLTRIVDKYLEFARPRPPQRAESNLNDLVRSVVELTGKQAARDGIDIEARYAEPMPAVVVDGDQIRQAVLNLVLNALQAMPGPGTVTVATGVEAGEAVCRVRDRGPGIGRDDPHRIVDKYLEFARPRPPQRVESNLNDLVRSVVELTGKQAARDGIDIEARYAEPMPAVVVDGDQIRQAVLNLVLNALQAMPGPGTVTVATGVEAGEAVCRVRDRGPGIGRDDPHRFFDPFFTTKTGGTGLGLPIAYRLIEQHGGRIDVSDHPDGGAQFSIRLPIGAAGEDRNAGTPGPGG